MEMYKFIDSAVDKYMTIGDVKKMSVGDTFEVVMFDSNFEEYWIWDNAENMKEYDPEIFFKSNLNKIIYKGNMNWDIEFWFGETFNHPVHICTSGDKATNMVFRQIDETNGHIDTHMCGYRPKERNIENKHWTEFPDDTKVGWRGPIILWSDLKSLGRVYYDGSV